jgi:hypothetical protein
MAAFRLDCKTIYHIHIFSKEAVQSLPCKFTNLLLPPLAEFVPLGSKSICRA